MCFFFTFRFAGPATTVTVFCPEQSTKASGVVRSEGEGVSETGERFTELVLNKEQIDILNNSSLDCVYVSGPPGTGKTVVLLLKAEQWMREGRDVQVVSMYDESVAASHHLEHCLRNNPGNHAGRVHLHLFDLAKDGNVAAVKKLLAAASAGGLYVVVDEVDGRYVVRLLFFNTHNY